MSIGDDVAQQAADDRAHQKRFSTLQAKLALHSFVLRKLDDGSYIVTRWGLCRELADLDGVARFVGLVGAA